MAFHGVMAASVLNRLANRGGLPRTRTAQGSGKRLAALGKIEATWIGVDMGSPPRQPAAEVWNELVPNDHDTHELGLRPPLPAPHTGADRTRTSSRR
jgi:hypothetical protein